MKKTDKSSTMLRIWLLAIFISSAAVIALHVRHSQVKHEFLSGFEVLVVGTSLTAFGVPQVEDGALSVFGDIRSQFRIGMPSATEEELLMWAKAAVAANIQAVAIEVNPIVFSFAFQPAECSSLRISLRELDRWQGNLRRDLKNLLMGRLPSFRGSEEPDRQRSYAINQDTLSKTYPLNVSEPCRPDAWRELSVLANGKTNLVFFLQPRSAEATRAIGLDTIAQIEASAIRFASSLNRPLFIVGNDGSWSDSHFVDQAHLSDKGSDRFLSEFRSWWGER